MRLIYAVFVISFYSCASPADSTRQINPYNYEINKSVANKKAAVVCAHPLASKVGVEIIKKGGNAFDAAIATQFALAVVYPGAGNIGGGGFMVARTQTGQLLSLDFRETAPGSAYKDMYLDSNKNVIAGASLRGPGSSGVPGTVAGCFEMLQYAKLSMRQLIDPAIELAKNGFAITEREALSLNELQAEFTKYNEHPTAFHRSRAWKEGDTLVQSELATVLTRIRDSGRTGFYEGKTAELIVDQMKRGGGFIGLADLKNYQAKWRKPRQFQYKDYEIVTMDLPSSGGIILQQLLTMIEPARIDSHKKLSTYAVQLMIEAERRAYADRAQFLGDPDFVKVPADALTNKEYLKKRMASFTPGKAGSSELIREGNINPESEETTHLSIVDAQGNAVSVTTTLNDGYGSKTVVAGAGFLLNNEMDDFSIKPGEPNLYGAVGGIANAIEPGKRMLSSMSPTIVLKNKNPFLVLGTPGGTTIPTSVFQTIVNIVDFGTSTSEAVQLPKFHHQWLPDQVFIERNFPDSTRTALEAMGYTFSTRASIGRTEVIRIFDNGNIEAVADFRGDDSAEGL